MIAFQIAKILNHKNENNINHELVYQITKEMTDEDLLLDDTYRATVQLLEDKYGILFDLEKKVDM